MLQDKKTKSSAKLRQNKKIKKCEKLVTYKLSDIICHKSLYLKINLFTNVFSNVWCLSRAFGSFYV